MKPSPASKSTVTFKTDQKEISLFESMGNIFNPKAIKQQLDELTIIKTDK